MRNVSRFGVPGAVCVCVLAIAQGLPLWASQQPVTVTVEGGRPLARASDVIEQRFGVAVTYEDPPYLNDSEISDVTLSVRRDASHPDRKILVPRRASLTVTQPALAGPPEVQERRLLEALLDRHGASGNPGVFRLAQTGAVFHVIPTMVKDAEARLKPYSPMLDTRITIGAGNRTGSQMLQLIVGAIGISRKDNRLQVGMIPARLLQSVSVSDGVRNESARAALLRLLDATGQKLSWRLFCDPGEAGTCMLNIHVVGSGAIR